MKKVLDKALERKFGMVIGAAEDKKAAASQIIGILKELQDASGVKVCTAVTKTDVAYREVK